MRIADMHCDTISQMWEIGKTESLRKNSLHLDLERMKAVGYLMQNFALYVDAAQYPDTTMQARKLLELYEEELSRNADILAPVYAYEDIWTNEQAGKMSALVTLEEGGILKGQEELLDEFYHKGVRLVTLTWNYPNEIGFPAVGDYVERGLTDTGKRMVARMEQLGVIVDVSHLSDAGFWDVADMTTKPFVASHSNARSLCKMPRNLTDDMIRTIGERGGVIGLNFYPSFLEEAKNQNGKCILSEGTIASVVAHAKHIANVGGIEVLGLGSDFDGIDGHRELPGVHAMPRLIDALEKAGFTGNVLDGILSGNVLRVYKEIL